MRNAIYYTIYRWEGLEYHNVEGDPGGATKFGISQKAYKDLDIESLTLEQAYEIYQRDYWFPVHADQITNPKIGWKLFDIAVNQGLSACEMVVNRALGLTLADLQKCIEVINTRSGSGEMPARLVMLEIIVSQIRRYTNLALHNPKRLKFLLGWILRALDDGNAIPIAPKDGETSQSIKEVP